MRKTFNIKGNFIALIIIVIPFFLYFHLLFDGNSSSFYFLGYEITNWTQTNDTFFWIILNDLVPLILLILMFFSTQFSFRFCLLPLIVVYFLSILFYLDIFTDFLIAFFSIKAFLIGIGVVGIIMVVDREVIRYYSSSQIYVHIYELLSLQKELNLRSIRKKIKNYQVQSQIPKNMIILKYLFHWKNLMENDIRKFRPDEINTRRKHASRFPNNLFTLLLLALLLLWFIHRVIPSGLMSYEIFGYVIDNNGFNDLRTFIWFVSRKFIVIGILSIWITTSMSWWRYAILSPLIIYSYQFWEAFQDVKELDAGGNLRVFPLVLLNVVLVILISRVVKYRAQFIAVYEEISREVDEMFEELTLKYPQEVESALEKIRQGKKGKGYKKKLRELEKELAAKLDLIER